MILDSEAYITSPKLDIYLLPTIFINNTALQYVELIKNLGIWLTPTLNWSPHVNSILKKVHYSLQSLNFYCQTLAIPLKKQLILTLVLPHFNYASIVFIDLDKSRTNSCKSPTTPASDSFLTTFPTFLHQMSPLISS